MQSHDTTFTREPNRRSRNPKANGHDTGRFTSDANWYEVAPEELASFTARVVAAGACVIFSKSSDGGVLSITVIIGNERIRAFPRSADDALVSFRDILDDINA